MAHQPIFLKRASIFLTSIMLLSCSRVSSLSLSTGSGVINSFTKSRNDLYRDLTLAVKKGHVTHTYDVARDFMFSTLDDRDNNNKVKDVYLGKTFSDVTNSKNAYNRGKGLTAEHTWPQSLGAGVTPAQSDLFALFPVETIANTVRNNHPFGEVKKIIKPLEDADGDGNYAKLGYDATGTIVFEPPSEHKGDVARALYYFYFRYHTISDKAGPFTVINFRREIPTLRQWSKSDPVSRIEKKRAEQITAFQGNINPFVAHPEFIEQLCDLLESR
jgi:deoxyribonuclease I